MVLNFIVLQKNAKVACLTLHRPDKKNALHQGLLGELVLTLQDLENDPAISVVVLTGGKDFFSAGADIREMADKTFAEAYGQDFILPWDQIAAFKKPLIAAVSGVAFGGGMELAMLCDIIWASETAVFAQPEVRLGIIPGAGGTQRLAKALGKSKTMELCLTGQLMHAEEALARGLVSKVLPVEQLLEKTLDLAATIAEFSLPVLKMVKEAVGQSFELPLDQGLHYERRLFQACFSLADQKEGMQAFLNKTKPQFQNR